MKSMKTRWVVAVAMIGLFALAQGARAESGNRLGVGVNYWTMVDHIGGHHIDKNGVSWLFTFQHEASTLVKIEADLEVFPEGFLGIDSTAYAPQVYLVLGSVIYGAVGVGILCADGDFADDPFFALRAGLDLEIIPQLHLDLNVNYRFTEWSNLSDEDTNIDGDTMMLGAAVRFEF